MTKSFFVSTIIIILFTGNVFAQQSSTIIGQELNAITTGVPFLTISPDARSGAMGDAGVASSPDANSIHWNPAKYAFIEQDISLNLSYIPWLRNLVSDINFQNISGSYRLNKNQTIAASLMYFSLGSIDFTNSVGTVIVPGFRPNEFSFDAAYALKLSKNMSGGIAFRYVHSNLTGGIPAGGSGSPTKPGNAVAGDISFFYTKDMRLEDKTGTFNFGVNISNLGSKISYSDDTYYDDFLPANLRIGASYKLDLDDYNSITAMIDINKLLVPTPQFIVKDSLGVVVDTLGISNDVSVPVGIFQSFYDAPGGFAEEMHELMYSVGIEYWYINQFAIRAGYFDEHGTKGNRKYFTMGIGVKLNVLNFDFAYVVPTAGRSNPLANTLRFTLGLNLENLK
ncbi:MAG: type IX secretion system outer membrane channel protein PorV [Bacteroidales bacterium]|nr:type IX secretion system outer membrane channel protein PorV [Bacteroidales bacterium]